jgi:uncharacterized membrane protein YdjX (TVP38/TMEM64 family)
MFNNSSKRHWQLLLAALFIGILVWLWTVVPITQWLEVIRTWILSLGIAGVVIFVLLYIFVTLVLGPATAMMLMAGLAYGAWGFPLVVAAATLAAAAAFLIGRYIAHERVNQWLEKKPKLLALNRAVSEEGWRVVALLRLSPVIPYGLQNYLFSVTHIKFGSYVLATLFGIMPATALYVYLGSLGQSIGSASSLDWVLAAAALGATALVAWLVGKRAAAALNKQIDLQE